MERGAVPERAGAELYVLDTSAVLALRGDESGAGRVEAILRRAQTGHAVVLLSFMTRMEVLYRVACDEGDEAAASAVRLLDATPCRWASCDADTLRAAARIKAHGGLSVADAWIAATAEVHGAILVHKYPEFRRVGGIRQEPLPR